MEKIDVTAPVYFLFGTLRNSYETLTLDLVKVAFLGSRLPKSDKTSEVSLSSLEVFTKDITDDTYAECNPCSPIKSL